MTVLVCNHKAGGDDGLSECSKLSISFKNLILNIASTYQLSQTYLRIIVFTSKTSSSKLSAMHNASIAGAIISASFFILPIVCLTIFYRVWRRVQLEDRDRRLDCEELARGDTEQNVLEECGASGTSFDPDEAGSGTLRTFEARPGSITSQQSQEAVGTGPYDSEDKDCSLDQTPDLNEGPDPNDDPDLNYDSDREVLSEASLSEAEESQSAQSDDQEEELSAQNVMEDTSDPCKMHDETSQSIADGNEALSDHEGNTDGPTAHGDQEEVQQRDDQDDGGNGAITSNAAEDIPDGDLERPSIAIAVDESGAQEVQGIGLRI